MAWQMKVDILESCSCAAMCPCILGPAKPDQGWCSAAFGIKITEGTSEGVDLSGLDLAMNFELPGDFISGIDKARLYIDSSASDDQRREIDAIFHGERGGMWGGMKEAIKEWLPSKTTSVKVTFGKAPTAHVEGFGDIVTQAIALEDGTPTTITGAPVLQAFAMTSAKLGYGHGTKFSDPDLRDWESLGEASWAEQVEWAG